MKECNTKHIFILCSSKDFHAMDWYKSFKKVGPLLKIKIITDSIESEGFPKLINDLDVVHKLFIIDKFLFTYQFNFGNIWRNFIKAILFPIQVIKLKKIAKLYPNSIYHAHSMYYIWLSWAANLHFIATPQGSDILIKPFSSKIYKILSILSLKSAKNITVDSKHMANVIFDLIKKEPIIIQNGIDIQYIFKLKQLHTCNRTDVVSFRGLTKLYNIDKIINARNLAIINNTHPINLIFPFYEKKYKSFVVSKLIQNDEVMGKLNKENFFSSLLKSKLTISLPYSDSSPRSVYEAIFCGSVVALTYHSFIDDLPESMRSRLIIIKNINDNWFDNVLKIADNILRNDFHPCEYALHNYDQFISANTLIKKLLN